MQRRECIASLAATAFFPSFARSVKPRTLGDVEQRMGTVAFLDYLSLIAKTKFRRLGLPGKGSVRCWSISRFYVIPSDVLYAAYLDLVTKDRGCHTCGVFLAPEEELASHEQICDVVSARMDLAVDDIQCIAGLRLMTFSVWNYRR